VLGYPVTSGNSFLTSLEKKLQAGQKVLAPLDEVRTPIDVRTLCDVVLELAIGSYSGRLQVGATSSIDRYALTRKLAALLGYPKDLVQYQDPGQAVPGRAPRHANGIISVAKAQSILRTPMLTVDQTLAQAIATHPISK
jgi:dTDP-4-dehydrorhamnose reductase